MLSLNNIAFGREIAKRAGCHFNPECDQVIARVSGEKLLGGVIYQQFTGESIAIHSASFAPNWLSRELLWVIFDYPFNQLGVKRIFGHVPESNTHALQFDLKVGFRIVTTIDGVFRDGGAIIIVLEKADCRWLDYKPRTLISRQEI